MNLKQRLKADLLAHSEIFGAATDRDLVVAIRSVRDHLADKGKRTGRRALLEASEDLQDETFLPLR